MKKLISPVVDDLEEIMGYMFYCPGCECSHVFYVEHPYNKLAWKFNGDMEKPTFSPSLLNTYPDGKKCHLFVKNGKIEYCKDSFHHLKGKTIPLEKD